MNFEPGKVSTRQSLLASSEQLARIIASGDINSASYENWYEDLRSILNEPTKMHRAAEAFEHLFSNLLVQIFNMPGYAVVNGKSYHDRLKEEFLPEAFQIYKQALDELNDVHPILIEAKDGNEDIHENQLKILECLTKLNSLLSLKSSDKRAYMNWVKDTGRIFEDIFGEDSKESVRFYDDANSFIPVQLLDIMPNGMHRAPWKKDFFLSEFDRLIGNIVKQINDLPKTAKVEVPYSNPQKERLVVNKTNDDAIVLLKAIRDRFEKMIENETKFLHITGMILVIVVFLGIAKLLVDKWTDAEPYTFVVIFGFEIVLGSLFYFATGHELNFQGVNSFLKSWNTKRYYARFGISKDSIDKILNSSDKE